MKFPAGIARPLLAPYCRGAWDRRGSVKQRAKELCAAKRVVVFRVSWSPLGRLTRNAVFLCPMGSKR
jgi:hypothetical protein